MQGDAPAAAPRGVIEALRDACDENGVLRLPNDDLKPGQSVRILSGAFADFVGEIDRLDDAGRVRVLLDIMGVGSPLCSPKAALCRRAIVFSAPAPRLSLQEPDGAPSPGRR